MHRAPIHLILKELPCLPRLESLVLSSSRVHDAKYQSYGGLNKLTQLTSLSLRGARSFGDSGVTHPRACACLCRLGNQQLNELTAVCWWLRKLPCDFPW